MYRHRTGSIRHLYVPTLLHLTSFDKQRETFALSIFFAGFTPRKKTIAADGVE
jgi:hypothetical protein